MPINACSINTYSVDAICSVKRTKYINALFTNAPSSNIIGNGGWAGRSPDFSEYSVKPTNYENILITMTLTLNGEVITQTFDNTPMNIRPLLSINKLSSSPSEISVQLGNIKLG